jgi:CRISPR-associated protein Csd1
MSALAALVRTYDRLYERGEVPAFGYSHERIGFLIPLNDDGSVAVLPIDLRRTDRSRLVARMVAVPASFKRPGVTPRAFFLWDNTAFALGVTASEGKDAAARLAAFRERHERELADADDVGLKAFLQFVRSWTPDHFGQLKWPEDMKDQNIIFALESERRQNIMIHDRPAARELWARLSANVERTEAVCLITGKRQPIARLHPPIKGVWRAQSSGASIVSFNHAAFTSYGHEKGDNAPVSEGAAFAYTTVLNHFLNKDSRHRIQIGDTSAIFWADASDADDAATAEDFFASVFVRDDRPESKKIGAILGKIRSGRPLKDVHLDLPPGVRFYVLGLSPSEARLSVRFYVEDNFGELAARYIEHIQRMRIDPAPKDEMPSMWHLLIETAAQRKSENIAPNLAGEWLRSILTGMPYPLTLLSNLTMRIRADHCITALRVAIIKSVLIRNYAMEVPVSLDPHNREQGYVLGRLFAAYEQIQVAALGRNINATIRDRFYGAAASQPRKVFPLLDKGSKAHLARLGKERRGYQVVLERSIAQIMEAMSPNEDPFPAHLPDKQQGLFALGYYHQRNQFYTKPETSTTTEPANDHA